MKPIRWTALALSAAMLLPLCGCRYSDVLAQIIYDQYRNGMVDITPPFELSENSLENEDESERLLDLKQVEEAERMTEDSPDQSVSGEASAASAAPQVEYEETADAQQNARTAPQVEQTEGETQATDVLGVEQLDALNNGQDMGGLGQSGTAMEANAGAATGKQVVDAYGNMVQIPENVQGVAATGDLAVMTFLLGGGARLVAANADLSSGFISDIFGAENNAEALWSGSGNAPLSDGNFDRLLALKPDVVVEVSGSATLTDAQVRALEDAEIAYLVLPTQTSLENVNATVTALGTVLGDKSAEGGSNAPQIAADYVAWTTARQAEVAAACAPYKEVKRDEQNRDRSDDIEEKSATYTLYIDGWDAEASYRLYNEQYTTLQGTGCAFVKRAGASECQAITAFLSYAQVRNTAGIREGIGAQIQYFTPLNTVLRQMEVTGTMADSRVADGDALLQQSSARLGTDAFPILLVPDASVAEAIRACELWDVYEKRPTGNGGLAAEGLLGEDGSVIATQIAGEYEIVVNPRGATSWTDGGCESILVSVWAAWRFFDAIPETQMRETVKEFYSRFYGYSLSERQLDQILEGDIAG